MGRYPAIDKEGRPLKVGDVVRVTGLPDTSSWTASQKDFSLYVFTSLVGKYKKIHDFDELGMAELTFRLKQGDTWEYHTVWLEPYLLRLRQRR